MRWIRISTSPADNPGTSAIIGTNYNQVRIVKFVRSFSVYTQFQWPWRLISRSSMFISKSLSCCNLESCAWPRSFLVMHSLPYAHWIQFISIYKVKTDIQYRIRTYQLPRYFMYFASLTHRSHQFFLIHIPYQCLSWSILRNFFILRMPIEQSRSHSKPALPYTNHPILESRMTRVFLENFSIKLRIRSCKSSFFSMLNSIKQCRLQLWTTRIPRIHHLPQRLHNIRTSLHDC